ncbi:carbonic anhydrase [Lentinula lateritia]|uniref:Carbonic anhydrase n=1 Tax=Lentinula aff. lateritia TaxID=2804960 RepID=A0ACC1UFV0_9AGAR|nr:carbonic anhydrase [Lentinula aff. lateritia]KAJ3854744.1 carbonic anhydrase [Lentinula lateritia]
MSAHLEFVEKNVAYAESFDKGHLPVPPAKKLLIVTCMDARIDCYKSLGLELGEAHIVRNAGGSARDAFRSILISQRLLGTREIAVFHHTNCGMQSFTAPQLRSLVKSDAQSRPDNEKEEIEKTVDGMTFYEFSDLEGSVREDVKYLKDNLLVLEEAKITGWIYDTANGKVRLYAFWLSRLHLKMFSTWQVKQVV